MVDFEYMLGMYQAIGASLNKEQQLFVSEHYKNIGEFLKTDKGKEAIVGFVKKWQESKKAA